MKGSGLSGCTQEENEIFHHSISAANSITAGTCSKQCNFQGQKLKNGQLMKEQNN